MQSRSLIICSAVVFCVILAAIVWQGAPSAFIRNGLNSSSSSVTARAVAATTTSPRSSSLASSPEDGEGTTEAPQAAVDGGDSAPMEAPTAVSNNFGPKTAAPRPVRLPAFDSVPVLFPPTPSYSYIDDAVILEIGRAKRRREVVFTDAPSSTTSATTGASMSTTASNRSETATSKAKASESEDVTSTTTSTAAPATTFAPSFIEQQVKSQLNISAIPRDVKNWRGWVAVPRIQAISWFRARFGDEWDCAVASDPMPKVAAPLLSELTRLAQLDPQRITDGSTWPLLHVPWRNRDFLYKECAPRAVTNDKHRVLGLRSDLGLPSASLPALGPGCCLRAVLVLDRRAPSLEVAMSRRCFRRPPAAAAFNDPSVATAPIPRLSRTMTPFVIGIGHSHTRYLAGMMCMSAELPWCDDFNAILRLPFYPKESTSIFDGVSPAFTAPRQGVDADVARQREEDQDVVTRSLSRSAFASTFKLAYVASYYDARRAIVRLLAWLANKAIEPHEMQKSMPLVRINFTSSLGVLSASDIARQDSADERIVTWAQETILPRLKRTPTHFFISRGEWDMLYLNPDPWALAQEMKRGLVVLGRAFSRTSGDFKAVVLQLPQVHVMIPTFSVGGSAQARKKHAARAEWRNVCSSDERRLLLRHINLCAASLAMFEEDDDNNNSGNKKMSPFSRPAPATLNEGDERLQQQTTKKQQRQEEGVTRTGPQLILFDSDRVTESHFGYAFVDSTGHHYIDEALEVLALEMRRIIERADVAAEYGVLSQRLLEQARTESCAIVKEASRVYNGNKKNVDADADDKSSKFQRCTCHNDVQLDPHFCRSTRMLSRET